MGEVKRVYIPSGKEGVRAKNAEYGKVLTPAEREVARLREAGADVEKEAERRKEKANEEIRRLAPRALERLASRPWKKREQEEYLLSLSKTTGLELGVNPNYIYKQLNQEIKEIQQEKEAAKAEKMEVEEPGKEEKIAEALAEVEKKFEEEGITEERPIEEEK